MNNFFHIFKQNNFVIYPLTSPGEMVSVFTSPYLSAGARALGEAKGLIKYLSERSFNIPIDIKYKLIPLKYFIKSQEEILLF